VSSIPLSNLDSVLTSTDKAKGLPNEHYVSEAVFEEEKKAILFDNWSAIGTGKDIPNIGDVKPIHFVGMPLIMVRDENILLACRSSWFVMKTIGSMSFKIRVDTGE